MFTKRFGAMSVSSMLTMLALFAGFSFSRPQAATITVGKSGAAFTSVQAAINAAKPGDVIEIIDATRYQEQITIDSSKNGITLRSKNPESLLKPAIIWRDTRNTSPKNKDEIKISGDGIGQAGNFEICGTVRVKYAKNITIDGIIIDGGSPFVFGANAVWNGKDPHFHGNAAITLIVAGNAQIRNCEFSNAYFGIYVKDRNTGGIFGNPNPDDIDVTLPLAGFGKAGNHLFEYNRVHDNAVGFFFESSWDLGSTVRYNLIYNNYYTANTKTLVTALGTEVRQNQEPGAFLFKDSYLSPIAIYNNTLYNNNANFIGNWQIGGQHLIFNNIFGQTSGAATGNSNYDVEISHKFPNRMKNSVFSAIDRSTNGISVGCQSMICDNSPNSPYYPAKCFVQSVRISNKFPGIMSPSSVILEICDTDRWSGWQSPTGQSQPQYMVLPGAVISGSLDGGAGTLSADANIRWLEMPGGKIGNSSSDGVTLPKLFQSTDTTSPYFLEPDWSHRSVIDFIKNQGWPESGIRNPDGTIADLGAIPSTSAKRQAITARIKPTSVVIVTGTEATAAFNISAAGGTLTNPQIKYLKWIYKIPDNKNSWATNFNVIPASAVNNIAIPATALKLGDNTLTFTIPRAISKGDTTGFFELTVEGTDEAGNTITSDIGFLPFRPISELATLRYTAGPGGRITGTLTQTVKAGTGLSGSAVTAVANTGYKFSSWSDGVKTAERTDRNVVLNVDVTAIFELVEPVTLIYNSSFGGVIDGQAVQVIQKGGTGKPVTVVTTHNRYTFVGWDDGKTGNVRTDANVQSDITVTAVFEASSYLLNYSAGPNGKLIGETSQDVVSGANGSVVTAVADEWYKFSSWSDGVKTAERTDKNVRDDITVTAIFEKNFATLNYSAGTGGRLMGTTAQKIILGSDGSAVVAVANDGYIFKSWNDGVTTAERTDRNVSADIFVTAIFERTTLNLKYNAAAGGKIVGSASQTVPRGSDGTAVTASANAGYLFTSWSDGVETAERTDKNVTADLTVTANFRLNKCTLSYVLGDGGLSLIGDSVQVVNYGASGTEVYAVAKDGYTFAMWNDGSTSNPRTDKSVAGDMRIVAYFADPSGHISVKSNDRIIPQVKPSGETAVIAPAAAFTAEFTAGPNPAGKSSGVVNFFRQGSRIKSASLSVYDASGSVVATVNCRGELRSPVTSAQSRRVVGTWDLTDKRGRRVGEGTYLVRGAVKTESGKRERVSLVVGVR